MTRRVVVGSSPVPVLRAALRDTLGEAVGAVEPVARLASLSNHEREEMAILSTSAGGLSTPWPTLSMARDGDRDSA